MLRSLLSFFGGKSEMAFKNYKEYFNGAKIQYFKLSSNLKVWITGDKAQVRSVEKDQLAFMEEIQACQQN